MKYHVNNKQKKIKQSRIDNDSGDVSWSLEGEISITFGEKVKDV